MEAVGEGLGCFSTIASSGTAITLVLVLVVIVAVELMPGRREFLISSDILSSSSSVTLNSFASWPSATLLISVSSTFTSTLIVLMSAIVISGVVERPATAYSPTRVGMSATT